MFDAMARGDDDRLDDPYDDAKVIARCVFDDNGKKMFAESDIPRIQAMGNDIFLGLVGACLEINGMGAAGREAIAKNSGTTQESDSESE